MARAVCSSAPLSRAARFLRTCRVWTSYYVGSGLKLKQMEKGQIELPWDDISTCAAGLLPALLLGRPGLEGPAYGSIHLRDGLAAGSFTRATGV